MARSRNIKPGLFKNEILGEADPIYTLLFIGLWTLADKEGRLENRPKRIRAELFPYRFDVDVSTALAWLKHESFITMYEVNQKTYIQINSWSRHQAPHHKESESIIPPLSEAEKIYNNQDDIHAQSKHDLSKDQARFKESASTPLIPDSLNLIPDSLIPDSLIPDSLIPDSLIPDSLIPDSLIPDSLQTPCREKNKKSETSEKGNAVTQKGQVEDIFDYWKSILNHPKSKLDSKRIELIKKSLKLGYSSEDLKSAIRGCSKTPHNMGDNERGEKYDSLNVIFRSADQVDRFMRNDHRPPSPTSSADKRFNQNMQAAREAMAEIEDQQ